MFESSVPFVVERIHAAAIYCSDGRWGEQMDEFLQVGLGLPRYDRLALPGGAGCLAGHLATWMRESTLVEEVELLVRAHGLTRFVLIAHHECAFYTTLLRLDGEERERRQRVDLETASQRLRRLHEGADVSAWFARRAGDRVQFEDWTTG